MGFLSPRRGQEVVEAKPPPGEVSLDELFARAAAFGRLRLFCMEDGAWHAHIDLPTNNKAIKAEIASNFNHKTPHEAIGYVLGKL